MSSNQLSPTPKRPPELLNFTLGLLVAIAQAWAVSAIAIRVLLTISVSLIWVHVAKQLKWTPTGEFLPIKLPLNNVPTIG